MISDLEREVEDLGTRCLAIGLYAGHAGPEHIHGNLVFHANDSEQRKVTMERVFGPLFGTNSFTKTDVILMMNCCFSGLATPGVDSRDRSVEIIASVGYDKPAHCNPSNNGRIQNRRFTSRLADEVARRIGREDLTSISFAEVTEELRRTTQPQRMPQYRLQLGRIGIRIPTPDRARLPPHLRLAGPGGSSSHHHQRLTSSESSIGPTMTIPPRVTALFKVHLEGANVESPEVLKLVQWLHGLNPNIGLQMSGLYMARSTEIIFIAP